MRCATRAKQRVREHALALDLMRLDIVFSRSSWVAYTCSSSYEEMLEAERRRVRAETRALQQRMRAALAQDE